MNLDVHSLKARHPGAWSAVRRVIPRRVRLRVMEHLVNRTLFSDAKSCRNFARARKGRGPERVPVAVRDLSGAMITIRPGTSDCFVIRENLASKHHLPPQGTMPRLIFDIGANNGVTVAHFAHLCPGARVIGLEPDADNAELARSNVAAWPNAKIVQGAVWIMDGTVKLGRRGTATLRIEAAGDVVPAVTINSLIERFGVPDYMKIDVEGAEREILRRSTEWAERVPVLNVEAHPQADPPYTVDECIEDLRALGYSAWPMGSEWPIVYAAIRQV